MRESIMFLPASIRSHVLPALYLADLLSNDYDIHFAVTSDVLEELVSKQGYNAIRTSRYRAALGMEEQYLSERKKKVTKWEILKSVWNNDVYTFRQNELSQIIDQIKPSVIFIDIFNSTDLLVLYPRYKNVKLLFLNPMLSTYRVNGFPTVDQGYWPEKTTEAITTKPKKRLNYQLIIKRPFAAILSNAIDKQFDKISKKDDFLVKHPISKDRTNALLFDNIPEIILAPKEFEVSPNVCKENQHYLGLCVPENRKDTELDPLFQEQIEIVLKKKQSGKRLIYCSFGTFYQGSDRPLLDFLNKLLDAIESIENVEAILSINKFVAETLRYQRKISKHIHMFSRVPQLTVLKYADLFVTHGGLGSIKESIYYGVPMLVYPLDLHYDQNGNGLKVEHHGLGLRGVFQFERTADMIKKMDELLTNDRYKRSVSAFRGIASDTNSIETLKNNLKNVTY